MRKIIVLSFITLDGVVQGSGGPTEDTNGDFTYGACLYLVGFENVARWGAHRELHARGNVKTGSF